MSEPAWSNRTDRAERSPGAPITELPSPSEPASLVPFPGLGRAQGAVPAPLTLFVGRERETAALSSLVLREDVRLVTLTGPGGVGKTRLSHHVASNLAGEFTHAATFVPLAAVRAPELVASAIAVALGARGDEASPRERLLAHLHNREQLLVLDNFEHITGAALLLTDLLTHCARLTLLVTSRVLLRLSGERVFPVPPLALPERRPASRDGAQLPPVEELVEVEAIRLFVDRAEAASGLFTLTPQNAGAVVAICERADGLPLAIELAAARAAFLSPATLLTRMERRLPLLTGGPRDQPDRLRTMRDAIAWSYDLLTTDEQSLFRRLSGFVGGCTVEAAEHVSREVEEARRREEDGTAARRLDGKASRKSSVVSRQSAAGREPISPSPATHNPVSTTHNPSPQHPITPSPTVLDLVHRLADQAVIVRIDQATDEPRIGMLESMREFGLERLAAHGEDAAVRDAHAAWCAALAERAEPELAGPNQAFWVERLEAEMGNIRAALDWLISRGDTEMALRLAGAIGWLWSTAPYLEEAQARFDELLALPDVETTPAALAKVLSSAGDVADWQGDQLRARAHYERALEIYRTLGDRWHTASMLRGLGSSAIDRGEPELAQSLLEESLTLARAVGHDWEAAAATNLLGVVASVRGDLSTALDCHEAAAEGWRQLGDTGHVTTALSSAGWVAVLAREGARAAAAFRGALGRAVAGQDPWYTTFCVIGTGALAASRGDLARAAELLAAGITERQRLEMPLRPHVQAALDQIIATLRARLGEPAFTERWDAGRAMTIDVAATMALALLEAFEPPAAQTPAPFGLTRRERDVLRLMAEGYSDKAIAEALFISRATASKHVAAILAKLDVDSRSGAAAMAIRFGLA